MLMQSCHIAGTPLHYISGITLKNYITLEELPNNTGIMLYQ